MKHFTHQLKYVMFFVVMVIIFSILGLVLVPRADNIHLNNETKETEKRIEMIRLSAVGDSLTEGIGDTTKSGGYLPLLQKNLADMYPVDVFQIENFGKSGDRSDQILKRLKKNEEMQQSVQQANAILLTVGGNDLLQAIQPKIFSKMTTKRLESEKETYYGRLEKLYAELRKLNPDAPIYQLGIYNPFYLNFSDITELQEMVDFWNKSSQNFVNEQENAYFVPINDDIYQGIPEIEKSDDKKKELKSSDSSSLNDLISSEDTFHPNNLGYQIIANAFELKMSATKNKWLK
ncbi:MULTISPECIES: SGNH/GDSL hydrolase family protein [Vagococcus]|uniref:SGNH/GDSL hydrolase family protein n=1 Tax=Vagococcus TaxID=2737 RepID=UPI000E4CDC36|nr:MULTISPECIES: SGNH/GDSL hydrolase family protein [Vagococcus]RHH71280.1 lipase [Vagococcus sp. AM17-17]